MAKDALERLFEDAMNSSNSSSASQYSVDDQMDVDDDFFGMMSNDSKDMLLSRIQKVELNDEPLEEPLNNFGEDIRSALDYNLVDESKEDNEIKEDEFKFEQVKLNDSDGEQEDISHKSLEYNSSLDEDAEEEEGSEEETEPEEPVVEHKRGRGRPRKKPLEETESAPKTHESSTPKPSSSNTSTENIKSLNDFMDSLAKDLINELRESNYRTHNFNKKQMDVILDYIENKI